MTGNPGVGALVDAGRMADLLVVTGPPGSGKSTVAALVVDAFEPAVLVPGDVFFSFWRRGGIPPWLPEAHAPNTVAITAAAAAAGTFAAGGYAVVYDGVLGPWFLPQFADHVARHGVRVGAQLHYAVLLPSVQVCRRRVAGRPGHGFTDDDATVRMHHEFATAEVAARHLVAEPPDDPAEVAQVVLERYAAGELRVAPRPGAGDAAG